MYIREQAVQVVKLVTNCLCSDSNTPVITQLLCLCHDAVTDVSVHPYLEVFMAVFPMKVLPWYACGYILCLQRTESKLPVTGPVSRGSESHDVILSISSCSSLILRDSFSVHFCRTVSGEPSLSCRGSSKSCCWRCLFFFLIILIGFSCST